MKALLVASQLTFLLRRNPTFIWTKRRVSFQPSNRCHLEISRLCDPYICALNWTTTSEFPSYSTSKRRFIDLLLTQEIDLQPESGSSSTETLDFQ